MEIEKRKMENNGSIVLIARLKVRKDAVEQAKQAAMAIVEDSRAENGCLNYDFHQSLEDETVFIWHETWKDKTAIEEHGKSNHFEDFSRRIKDLTEEPLQITLAKMVSEKA